MSQGDVSVVEGPRLRDGERVHAESHLVLSQPPPPPKKKFGVNFCHSKVSIPKNSSVGKEGWAQTIFREMRQGASSVSVCHCPDLVTLDGKRQQWLLVDDRAEHYSESARQKDKKNAGGVLVS